ncbi:hypothetical protein BDW02DRAFT_568624 [Decorospora gaudefroyi]|uniref:Nudix hydrolase domain-containing protein n=1 Tax=Decorospora gaudefroyi TaxID=184978 RepID=A0A6A5KC58_9PLEO|nr:hypothetical protein BDW02DRAFT_568624 [Decorospora gaudefroyi]
MLVDILDQNPPLPTPRQPSLILKQYNTTLTPPVPVYLPHNLTTQEFLSLLPDPDTTDSTPAYTFPALRNWLTKLLKTLSLQQHVNHPFYAHPYRLRQLDIEAADWFVRNAPGMDDRLGFMKIQSTIETDAYLHDGEQKARPDWVPGAVFLRGGSVGILIILQPEGATNEDEKQVLLTMQPRIAAGSLNFTEIPAGMLDDESGTFTGKAAQEIKEEAHLDVTEDELLNMSALALPVPKTSNSSSSEELREQAIYPSPGACDEFMPLLLCQKRISRRHMAWLQDRATGLANEGEQIRLRLVPLTRMWREAGRDAKALAALCLYGNLRAEGCVPDMPTEVEREPEELRGSR